MSNLTVTSPSAPSMRGCCNTTLQTIGHELKKIGTWTGVIATKVAEAVKPYLQKIAAAILIAGSIAWNNTKVSFINHRKELALVGLGIAITLGVAALVKAIQFCYTMNNKSGSNPGNTGNTPGGIDPNANAPKNILEEEGSIHSKEEGSIHSEEEGSIHSEEGNENSEEDITPPPSPTQQPLPAPDAPDIANESSESEVDVEANATV